MIRTAIRGCPVCGHPLAETLHSQSFASCDGESPNNGYDVVACPECGFVYADTGTPQQTYDALYQSASRYQDVSLSTGGGNSGWDAERLDETAKTLSAQVKDKRLSILDVGCANGGLIAALSRLGHTACVGVDPSPVCIANAQARGLDARVGSLGQFPPELGRYDVVILSHVLEHIRDVGSAMASLHDVLHRDSMIYLEVPDASRYYAFVSAPFQDFNTEHINHFSGVALDNIAWRAGFVPLTAFTQKTVKASADNLYPAVSNFYRCDPCDGGTTPVKDELLKARILEYIAISSVGMRDINSRLARALQGCDEIALWGTGQLALKLLNEEPLQTAVIRACIDSNPVAQGRYLRNVPVLPPSALLGTDYPIVIASTLHEAAIRQSILDLGIQSRLISLKAELQNTEATL